jgi:acetamidase/formamidase
LAHHHLSSSPSTVHWGWFDANLPPVLTIDSGDQITVDTVSGGPASLPGPGFHVPPELLHIHAKNERRLPGHILTGPIAVRGAEPGDVLEIRILDVQLRQDWGYTFIRPLAGALPLDFDVGEQMTVALDRARGIGRLPWGTELALRPFFGVMGVAPPAGWGAISSIQPRAHGGNLDNKELLPGSTLYLPVWTAGGLLSLGDGHALQGDGEVCTTAIETALTGTLQVVLRKDLDTAAQDALRRMLDWLVARSGLSRPKAFMLMSLAADVRVTQLVNEQKGIHVMLPKHLMAPVVDTPSA